MIVFNVDISVLALDEWLWIYEHRLSCRTQRSEVRLIVWQDVKINCWTF